MDDQFLDEVLQKVQQKDLHYDQLLEATYTHEEVIFKLRPALTYLLENGFIISRDVGPQKYFDISPKGMRLEKEGGFVQITKAKQDLANYAKGSYLFARKAYVVGVAGVIIGIIAIFVPFTC